jgi:hypothetical protein
MAVGDKIHCLCESDAVCSIEVSTHTCKVKARRTESDSLCCRFQVLADRGLERRIADAITWTCTCGTGPFNRAAPFEVHLRDVCNDRLIACTLCQEATPSKDMDIHKTTVCTKRLVECTTCKKQMTYLELGGHKRVAAAGQEGCVNMTFCDECDDWYLGDAIDGAAKMAHNKICHRAIVKCNTCPLECPRMYLEAHRKSDVLCLRAQVEALTVKVVKMEVEVEAVKLKTIEPTLATCVNFTNTRTIHRALNKLSWSLNFIAEADIKLGVRVLVKFKYCPNEWFSGEIVAQDGDSWLVNPDGGPISSNQWCIRTHMVDPRTAQLQEMIPGKNGPEIKGPTGDKGTEIKGMTGDKGAIRV